MITFEAQQIRRFLEAVDKRLSSPVRLVIIGGSAALLQHGAKSPTRDIDAFEGDVALLKDAANLAERDIGFAVPVARAAVADLPLNYEDRLERPMPELRRLEVVVPERHDLVLSKLIRASQADLVVCKEIHAHTPLKLDVLLHRYSDEMKHAIGRKADHIRTSSLLSSSCGMQLPPIARSGSCSTAGRMPKKAPRYNAARADRGANADGDGFPVG